MARQDIADWLVCKAFAAYWQEFNALFQQELDDPSLDDLSLIEGMKSLRFPYDFLAEWTGQSPKVCWAAMERACAHDLVEYGVSLRTGWLTEKGQDLLRSEAGQ